jgi:tetratricopeptide (TPR) repeat protein
MWAVALGPLVLYGAVAQKDQDVFNQGKVLMFEQKWEEARQAFWRVIRDFPQSSLLPQAYFQDAYCLRLQKKHEDALLSYEQFLKKYPGEPYLAAEARQAVVDLAASLFEQGKQAYRGRLVAALKDPRKEVRYFAALRCSSLNDRDLNSQSVPILREIVAKEKQQEFVAPASIALLKIDPAALRPAELAKQAKSNAKKDNAPVKMFHLRIYQGGENTQPKVELDIPVSLAQLAVMALDEPTKAELRKKGVDIDNIWDSLNRLGPTNILTIRSGASLVKLWIK